MLLPLIALLATSAPSDTILEPAAAPAAVTSKWPLEAGGWGIGFRIYGSTTPEIRIRRALSDRLAVGINVGWNGAYETDESTSKSSSSGYSSYAGNGTNFTSEMTDATLQIALPVEWIATCHGTVCATASVGPMYKLFMREDQSERSAGNSGSNSTGSYSWSESTSHRFGATGSLGIRWEFLPGLALASSFGADAWYSFSDNESGSETYSNFPSNSSSSETSTGYGTGSWFGGFGLDAWF